MEAIRVVLKGAVPTGIPYVRAARDFRRRLQLPTSLWDQVRLYVDAERYGLTALPPMRLDSGTVVDVGANRGDFTATILRADPRASVLAVEPGAVVAELRERFAADPRVSVDDRAVSDSVGTADLYETNSSVFTSLNKPADVLTDVYGTSAVVTAASTVRTVTLDEIVGDRPVSVLKVDVQGGERALIAGGPRTLAKAKAVLLEVNFVTHYEGEATFPELHGLMAAHGFELRGFGRMFEGTRGTLLWADACYIPAQAR